MGAIYRQNLKGFSTWRLVAEALSVEEQVEDWESMQSVGLYDYEVESVKFYMGYIKAEIERRKRPKAAAGQVSIQALKDLAQEDMPEILGHYMDVVVEAGGYKFKCPIHGDEHPSGVFYPGRWWCFGCSKGGDIFDGLMFFGRLTFGEAVSLLQRIYGLTGRGNGGY